VGAAECNINIPPPLSPPSSPSPGANILSFVADSLGQSTILYPAFPIDAIIFYRMYGQFYSVTLTEIALHCIRPSRSRY